MILARETEWLVAKSGIVVHYLSVHSKYKYQENSQEQINKKTQSVAQVLNSGAVWTSVNPTDPEADKLTWTDVAEDKEMTVTRSGWFPHGT